jgi:hypothetical protein
MSDQQETCQEKSVELNDDCHLKTAYEEICTSYHAIDDIRMKLLGLLPIATGAGVFLLLNKDVLAL